MRPVRLRKSCRVWKLFWTARIASAAAMASTLAQSPDGGVTRAAAPAVAAAAHDQPAKPKKLHGRAFYESIGSPKFIVAPMVDQSEFVSCPWRGMGGRCVDNGQCWF